MALLIGWGEVMTQSNVLPYDGEAILIDDAAEFDWPAITRELIDTIPWQYSATIWMGGARQSGWRLAVAAGR